MNSTETPRITLKDFLLARVAEDEERARRESHRNPDDGGYYACPATRSEPYGDLGYGEDACDCGLAARRARVLAECEAKRRIIENPHPSPDAHDQWEDVLLTLAEVYADHPDYRDEWRP